MSVSPTAFADIIARASGEDPLELSEDVLDTEFVDLGYDSLTLLEAAGLVKREYGVEITDDDLDGLDTPRRFLDRVNDSLVAA